MLLEVRYVELSSNLGIIHDEEAWVHVDVVYGARVFRPEKGMEMSKNLRRGLC